MENKRLILVMLLSFLVITIWMYGKIIVESKYGPKPQPATNTPTQPATSPTTQFAGTTRPTTMQGGTTSGGPAVVGAETKEDKVVGLLSFDPDKNNPITMGLKLNATGAGVDSVVLRRDRADLKKNDPYVYQKPYDTPDPFRNRALATQGISLNGTFVDLANVVWKLDASTDTSATYSTTVKLGAAEVRVRKTYRLQKADAPGGGYEIDYVHDVQNASAVPVEVKLYFNGPNVPPSENSRDIPEVVAGYLEGKDIKIQHTPATSFKVEDGAKPVEREKYPRRWVGLTGAYFNAIVRPAEPASSIHIAAVRTQALKEVGPDYASTLNLTFESTPVSLAPSASASLHTLVHFGPKSRALLRTDHYQKLGYNQTLVLTSGPCGWCTFEPVINVLVWLLEKFYLVLRDWGLAIIVLVCLVRLLLHPITKKSQLNMAKFGKLAPEIEKLKKKHGDDKEALNKAMMQFYKEHGATPILGCLPMLLQMPIWIALWSSLQSTFELRHAPFLYGWTWIDDLSQPDRLIPFGRTVGFWHLKTDALNLLPLLLGVVFYIQQKLTPKPPAMTPEQEQQQKIMQYMTLLFPLLLYNGPAGLNLYIFASTLIGIIESKRIRDHLKAVEEAEKAGRVIIDAGGKGPKRGGGGGATAVKLNDPPKPQGILGKWMAGLQAKAEALRKEAEKKKNKKRP